MSMITFYISDSEEFYADLFGYLGNELGLLSFIGRKQGIDRALALLHQQAPIRTKDRVFQVQPDLFRAFRVNLARGIQKVFLLPKDTPKKVKKLEESEEQNASDPGSVDPSLDQDYRVQTVKYGSYDPLNEIGIQFVSCWRGKSREGLWARIVRESPIPLQPQWGEKLVPLFVHHQRLDELRQDNGYPPRHTHRLKKMQFLVDGDGLWAGASVDLDGVDIAVAAREGLIRNQITFVKESA